MSYRKKHIKTKIGSIKPRKSIFKKIWFWLAVLFFIIAGSVFYTCLFYSGIQVKNISISGNEKISEQELKNFVLERANTGLINFANINIWSRSILLVNNSLLRKSILEKFPIIEKLDIKKDFPNSIILGITERKPIGVFCTQDEKCFLIDQSGIIFEPVSFASENITVVRQLISSAEVFTGEEAVSQNMITAIYNIQKSLKDNFKIDLAEALVTSPVRLNVKTNENWQVYFDLSSGSDIGAQITELNLLLGQEITEDGRKNLRYIDLRPKDRAIICDNAVCGGM